MNSTSSNSIKRLAILFVIILAVAGVGYYFWRLSNTKESNAEGAAATKGSARPKVELVKDRPLTIVVPEEVRASLGIRKAGKDIVAVAEMPKARRPLVLSASTAFDPANIYRIRNRFAPADVVRIEKNAAANSADFRDRELRVGDEVKENMPLAELYSVDLGAKKNDLIDALVQMKNDKELLENAEVSSAVPRALMVAFEKALQSDINATQRALRVLEAWKIPNSEIEDVYRAADEIFHNRKKRDLTFKKYDPDRPDQWGKIILRAPFNAIIVEKNLSERETLLDPTLSLFQLAKADRLLVLAQAPEEKIKELYSLWSDLGLQWTIRTLGEPNSNGIVARISEIGYLADPNTHTIPIKGLIPNPDQVLRAGQFVTATIELPAPKNVVELPASAIADDGKQSIVFVQEGPDKPEFTLRRVVVVQRKENRVLVRSQLSDQERELSADDVLQGLLPKSPLLLGERVITAGLLELKKELEDLEAEKGE
jgi:membrane fusion protein, heavy metal efflux system